MRQCAGREDYVPFALSLSPPQRVRFEQECGKTDPAETLSFATRNVGLPFREAAGMDALRKALSRKHPDARFDEWGIGHIPARDGTHFESLVHPASTDGYPFPLPADDAQTEKARVEVNALHTRGLAAVVAVAPVGGTVFWPAYKLCGMEELLCDLFDEDGFAGPLLDAVTAVVTEQAARAAATGADVLHLADDLGTQISTYISPTLFRRWFAPPLRAVVAAARAIKTDILVHFHSDGMIEPLIGDLIEIGVDILNPVQPECMDPYAIKARYGSVLSFSGGLGTQTTLPFATAREVYLETLRLCELMGKGGGYWARPTHLMEPEVPWENVLAFLSAVKNHNS